MKPFRDWVFHQRCLRERSPETVVHRLHQGAERRCVAQSHDAQHILANVLSAQRSHPNPRRIKE